MGRTVAIATALLCACGAEFIEPNPPHLVRTRIEYQGSSAAEPAVWLLVSDLFLEHDEDCAQTVAWLGASIRSAVPASVPDFSNSRRFLGFSCFTLSSRAHSPRYMIGFHNCKKEFLIVGRDQADH